MKQNLTESFRSTLNKLDELTMEAKAYTALDFANAINNVWKKRGENTPSWSEHNNAETAMGQTFDDHNIYIEANGDGTFNVKFEVFPDFDSVNDVHVEDFNDPKAAAKWIQDIWLNLPDPDEWDDNDDTDYDKLRDLGFDVSE